MTCKSTGKQGYPTRKKAEHAMHRLLMLGSHGRGMLAAYLCMACGEWHFGHAAKVTVSALRRKKKAPRHKVRGAEEDDGRWR